ncbi:MAG: hypothetical protein AAF202_00860 [Pseudomonadota bacterium]
MNLMTFVLLSLCAPSLAAPSVDGDLESSSSKSSPPEEMSRQRFETLGPVLSIDNSPLKKPKPDPLNFMYPYKRSITARTGLTLDPQELKEGKLPLLIGAAYMLFDKSPRRYEALFNFTTNSVAQLGLTRRHMVNEPNHYRGFWSYGAVVQMMPEERLATFANLQNYFAAASLGMEDVMNMPKSVRLEIQLLAGTAGQAAILYVGSSWGLSKGR